MAHASPNEVAQSFSVSVVWMGWVERLCGERTLLILVATRLGALPAPPGRLLQGAATGGFGGGGREQGGGDDEENSDGARRRHEDDGDDE